MKNMLLCVTIVISMIGCVNKDNKQVIPTHPITDTVSLKKEQNKVYSDYKPFANPVFMYGSSFGNYFQILYKTGKFEEMLKLTSSESIKKFGKNKILNFYKNMDFAYTIKLKSLNKEGDLTTLNYEGQVVATKKMLRINVIIENDTAKIVLKNLNSLK